jgi:pentatricopeptide repeat protein
LRNELSLALEDIDYSITTDPYNGWAYRNKGIYYLKTGDAASAIRLLNQAIELEPSVEKGYYYLAEAYTKSGDTEKACEAWRESIKRGEAKATDSRVACKNL